MTKDKLISQHKQIKFLIEKNVNTIKFLIDETSNIKKVINYLNNQQIQPAVSTQLERSLNHINESVKNLLHQTNSLVDAYQKFITLAFKK
ncbi:MAG: hypothetical protein WC872_03850 [Candidatus Absconditabacterales bacterium]